MRMRNLPWAKSYLDEQAIVINDPTMYQGKWKKILNCQELHIEIGSGKGDYWLGMAALYSNIGWIGIEKNPSVAALAIKKYEQTTIADEHMAFIQNDADHIGEWFQQGEVDVIHLNFSDPWHKKRNHKRRLSSPQFITQYQSILSEHGSIQMKTDNQALFEYSILTFQNEAFYLEDIDVNYHCDPSEDVMSEYEQKFVNLNQPIYRAIWRKKTSI